MDAKDVVAGVLGIVGLSAVICAVVAWAVEGAVRDIRQGRWPRHWW